MRNNPNEAPALVLAAFLVAALLSTVVTTTARPAVSPENQNPPATQTPQPAVDEWGDDFDGDQLDDKKWEPYTFEGGGGGKIEVKEKQLRMRGSGGSRSGVRSKQSFHGERFYVEAALGKVGIRTPQPGEGAFPPGYAILAVLFDGNPANRIEWLIRRQVRWRRWNDANSYATRWRLALD